MITLVSVAIYATMVNDHVGHCGQCGNVQWSIMMVSVINVMMSK